MSNIPLGQIEITVECSACGARASWPDNASDATMIDCLKCGEQIGTYGDIERAAHVAGRRRVDAMLRSAKLV